MIVNQEKAVKSISSLLNRQQVHHALLFYGPHSVGKLTTALTLVKSHLCLNPKNPVSSLSFCDECTSCRSIDHFNHPNLNLISTEDLLPKIKFLQILLQNNLGNSEVIIKEIISSVKNLLSRHKLGHINRLERVKMSYSEGKVIKKSENDTFFAKIYFELEKLAEFDTNWLKSQDFIKQISKLQNSLDRTFIPKQNLIQALQWTKTRAGEKKWLIIENINLINPQTVGVFLKTLEDPDPDTHFILICDDISKINQGVINPLLSRCFKVKFNHLEGSVGDILQKKFNFTSENKEYSYSKNMSQFFHYYLNHASHDLANNPLDLSFFDQPIHQQMKLFDKNEVNIEEMIFKIKYTLEQYLKTNHNKNISFQESDIPFRESDIPPLLKLIHELDEASHNKIAFTKKDAFLRISSYFKKILLRKKALSKAISH